jgi:hypothetical protein
MERIGGLDARLARAQSDIDDLKKSSRGRIERIGIIIGFLGGLIAIPKIVADTYDAIYNPQKTGIEWSKPLDVRYDVHDQVLRLEFPLTANNDGPNPDSIESVSASLGSVVDPTVNIPVSESDIQVSEDQKPLTLPIPLEREKAKSLTMALSLGQPFSEQALTLEGTRVVRIVLTTRVDKKKRIESRYCFNFDNAQGKEALAAKEFHWRTPFDCQ